MEHHESHGKSPIWGNFTLPACKFLPEVIRPHGHMVTRVHATAKCERYYFATLCYAQSLWREGKPAQAILQRGRRQAP